MTGNEHLKGLAVKEARKRLGKAWDLLGEELQAALVAEQAMLILVAQVNQKYRDAQELVLHLMDKE